MTIDYFWLLVGYVTGLLVLCYMFRKKGTK